MLKKIRNEQETTWKHGSQLTLMDYTNVTFFLTITLIV